MSDVECPCGSPTSEVCPACSLTTDYALTRYAKAFLELEREKFNGGSQTRADMMTQRFAQILDKQPK